MNVEVTLFDRLSAADISQWQAIIAANPALQNPLFDPYFTRVLAEFRPDTRVAVGRDGNGKAIAFLPHQLRPDGLARPLGAPFGDYQAVITDQHSGVDRYAFLKQTGFKAFAFSGLFEPKADAMGAGLEQVSAFRIALSGKGDDYLEVLRARSPKRYKNWRRLQHKTEREIGPIRLSAPDQNQATLETLLDWKAAQMNRSGITNVLHPQWVRTMMRTLQHTQMGDLTGLMITMWAGDTLLAGHFGVRSRTVFHPWMAAINPDFHAYSPGQTYLIKAIGAMNALGLSTYDLGTGHAHYKAPFCNDLSSVGSGLVALNASQMSQTKRHGIITKVAARIDHIASVELTLPGRIGGVLAAVRHAGTRLRQRGHDDAHEMGA